MFLECEFLKLVFVVADVIRLVCISTTCKHNIISFSTKAIVCKLTLHIIVILDVLSSM